MSRKTAAQEVAKQVARGRSSTVEQQPSKLPVVGSSPIARSTPRSDAIEAKRARGERSTMLLWTELLTLCREMEARVNQLETEHAEARRAGKRTVARAR